MFLQKVESKNAPKAIGAYSPAVKLGDFMYMSGQLGINPETGELVEGVAEQTQQAMDNVVALLEEKGLGVRHITKTTIFVTNMDDFKTVDEIYGSYFEGVFPARSTVQVAALPKGGQVEIECMVLDTLLYEQQMQQQSGGCGCGGEGSCGCGGESSCCEGDDCDCK